MYFVSGLESGSTGICLYTSAAACNPSCSCWARPLRGFPGSGSSGARAAASSVAAKQSAATGAGHLISVVCLRISKFTLRCSHRRRHGRPRTTRIRFRISRTAVKNASGLKCKAPSRFFFDDELPRVFAGDSAAQHCLRGEATGAHLDVSAVCLSHRENIATKWLPHPSHL